MIEYEIFESKLNHLSLDELDSGDEKTISILIDKLKNVNTKVKHTQNFNMLLSRFAGAIARADVDINPTKYRIRGIHYSNSKRSWVANHIINGKLVHIKSGKDKDAVQKAFEEFCQKHGLRY